MRPVPFSRVNVVSLATLAVCLSFVLAACGGADQAPTVELLTTPPSVDPSPTATAEPATATTESTATSAPTLVATATPSPTNTPNPSATATSSPTPEPTPTATDTPVPPTPTVAEGSVVITGIVNDPPVGRDADGETVTVANTTEGPVDMTGWTLTDIAEHTYVFPPFVLQPGASVVVHICDGEDSDEILFWGRCSAIWNNDGDTAYLHDTTGRLIATFTY